MERVWHGPAYTLPFLYLGTWRRIMFPEHGRDVPFTIENYAYVDGFGRETVTWVRTFETPRRRRFDAYMVYSEPRGCIVDYLGTHQHLAVDLELSVDDRGGLHIRSGEQRFYEGPAAFRFPPLISGVAEVCESYDDALGRVPHRGGCTEPALGATVRLSRYLRRRVAPRVPRRNPARHHAPPRGAPRVGATGYCWASRGGCGPWRCS